jgi:hypothetical protein
LSMKSCPSHSRSTASRRPARRGSEWRPRPGAAHRSRPRQSGRAGVVPRAVSPRSRRFTSRFHDQRSLYAAGDGCVQNEPSAHRELIAPHKPSAVDGRRRRYNHESESAAASSPPRDDHGRTFAGALRIALPGLSAENRNFRCLACAAGSLEAAREDILTPEGR